MSVHRPFPHPCLHVQKPIILYMSRIRFLSQSPNFPLQLQGRPNKHAPKARHRTHNSGACNAAVCLMGKLFSLLLPSFLFKTARTLSAAEEAGEEKLLPKPRTNVGTPFPRNRRAP